MAIRRISDLPYIENIDNISEDRLNSLLGSVIEISEKVDEDENVSSYDSKCATIGQLTAIILDKVVNKDISFNGVKTFNDSVELSGGASVNNGMRVNGDVTMKSDHVEIDSQETKIGQTATVNTTIEDDESVVNVKYLNEKLNEFRTEIEELKSRAVGMMFNEIFPVGSLFLSLTDSEDCPITQGKWTKVEGRYLLCSGKLQGGAAKDTYKPGDLVKAGAPSVSVSFTVWGGGHDDGGSGFAFGNSSSQSHTVTASSGGFWGSSGTLRPAAIAVAVWQRTE